VSQGVTNGQLANQNTFNSGFLSRKDDTDTIGKVDLNNADPLSGAAIVNIQKNINALASALGISVNQASGLLVTWASSIVGLSSSSVAAKIEALVLKFQNSGGHTHDGTQGDGSAISALNLSNINTLEAQWQKVSQSTVSGTSVDISSLLTGKTAGGTSSQVGVITAAPDNKCFLVDSSNGTLITDTNGLTVYGRLDSSFILSFFKLVSGVETAHTLASTDLDILFLEVFTIASRPTIPQFPALFGNLDTTNDVTDATNLVPGKVNIGTQTFGGDKTFNGFIKLMSSLNGDIQVDSSSTGTVTLATPTKLFLKITSAVTQIDGITAPANAQIFCLINGSGANITLKAADTLSSDINSPADLVIENKASALLSYDTNSSRWVLIAFTGYLVPQAVGSTPNANGVSIVGNKITLQPANNTNPGILTATAQALGGQKTFTDGLVALTQFVASAPATFQQKVLGAITNDTTTTGSNQTLTPPNTMAVRLANTSLLSLDMLDNPEAGKMLFVINDTGNILTINNATGATAANQIITGTAAAVLVPNGAVFMLIYDSNSAKWRMFGNFTAGGGGSGGGKQQLRFMLNGAYGSAPSYPQLSQDGFHIFPEAGRITDVILFVETAGTGGTTELDVKIKTQAGATFDSIFTTTPKATSGAGSNKWIALGQTVAGMTAPVLTTSPLNYTAFDAIKIDIITAQTGSPQSAGLIVVYEKT